MEYPRISVFHDESGDYGHSEWVFTGLLWIQNEDIVHLDKDLKELRKKENYQGEIHFNEFAGSFGGLYGAKSRVAREWFKIWKNKWSYKTWFNVLAVKVLNSTFDKKKFTKDFHAYNRFTALTLKSGFAWHFKYIKKILLRIYSDGKSRRPDGLVGDGIKFDNFEEYLVRKIFADTIDYKGPKVGLEMGIECLECKKKDLYSAEEEILQLNDLLLGSVATAVYPKCKKETKIWFADNIIDIIKDTRKYPWEQEFKLHRRFSLTYFPGKDGSIYNNGVLGILSKGQKTFFKEE